MAAVTNERADALRAEWRRIAAWAAVLKRADNRVIPVRVVEPSPKQWRDPVSPSRRPKGRPFTGAPRTTDAPWPELVAAELERASLKP